MPPPINLRVLVKLAHDALDFEPETASDAELSDTLKALAGLYRLPYNGRAITKALDSARAQRIWSNRHVGNPHQQREVARRPLDRLRRPRR